MAKRQRLPDLADDQRCTRNGTKWRCHLPRLPNKCFCRKHHALNLARSQSKSIKIQEPQPQSQSPTTQKQPRPKAKHKPLREIWAFRRAPGDPHLLYARIDRLVPSQPLVVVTPLLNPSSPDAACGVFRVADSTEVIDVGLFSHRVCFEMEEVEGEGEDKIIYKIYPKRGEVWAVELYGWVEMVSGFGEMEGASGAVLEGEGEGEEGGFFLRRRLHEGCELIRRFRVEEVSMFLHRASEARVVRIGALEHWRTEALTGGASTEENGAGRIAVEANGASTDQRITDTQEAVPQEGNPQSVDGAEGGGTVTETLGGLGNPQTADSTGRGRGGRGRGLRGRSATRGRRGKIVIPRGRGGTRRRSTSKPQPGEVADHESGQTSEPIVAQPLNQFQMDNQQNLIEAELYQIFKF